MWPLLIMWISAAYAEDGTCTGWSSVTSAGTISSTDLDELSGLVVHSSGAALWAHNDGGKPWLYAIGLDGSPLGRTFLPGAAVDDWEDLAAGPCPGEDACGRCLYVADIGNNSMDREGGIIYALPEPAIPVTESEAEPPTAIAFTWPDGIYDAEAFVVHPATGEALLVTKGEPARIYSLDLQTGDATLRGELDLSGLAIGDPAVTGADVSPDGLQLVLRTDTDILLFDAAGMTLADALTGTPTLLPPPPAEDAEAIAFSFDGRDLYTAGESDAPVLWTLRCDDFTASGDTGSTIEACPDETCGCQKSSAALLLLPLTMLARRRRQPGQVRGSS